MENQFVIVVHCGFMIVCHDPKFRNCEVTKDVEKAKKFTSKNEAKIFIAAHNGEGVNNDNAKIRTVEEMIAYHSAK